MKIYSVCLFILLNAAVGYSQIRLAWDASQGATGYNVYCKAGTSVSSGDKVTPTPVAQGTDAAPYVYGNPGQIYACAVTAVNPAAGSPTNPQGESGFSITVVGPQFPIPPVPGNLRIVFMTPTDNAVVAFRTFVPVKLLATEDAVRVQLYADGKLVATSPQRYLNMDWFAKKKGTSTLKGVAYDVDSNKSPDAIVQVQVR